MVMALLRFVMAARVAVLEMAGVALLAVAGGLWFGAPGVCALIGVALLAKSFELDLRKGTP